MARIRSVHPGLWTDEAFVSLTPFARLFFMGLWGECDDMGSFEWSPLKLKMRILPADGVDAGDLLAELEQAGCIMRYEVGGRTIGAVRNFCQFQRPKKPNSAYPQTEAVRNWVGTEERSKRDGSEPVRNSGGSGSEPVGNQLPTGGEKARQMEDGDTFPIGKGADAPPVDLRKVVFDEGVKLLTQSGQSARAARGLVAKWCKAHGEGPTREALVSAGGRADPVSWIEGRWRTKVQDAADAAAISHARAERYRRMDLPGPPPEVLARMVNGAICLPEPEVQHA